MRSRVLLGCDVNRRTALGISALLFACGPPRNGPDEGALDASIDGPPRGDGPVLTGDTGAEPTVEFATGQSDVERLSPSDPTVELVYGAQGGYHVWGRARFTGLPPDVDVWFEALELPGLRALHTPAPGRRWIDAGVRRGLRVEPDGAFVTDPDLVVLNITCTAEVLGRMLRVVVHVRDRGSLREYTATRDVRVVDMDPSPACVAG